MNITEAKALYYNTKYLDDLFARIKVAIEEGEHSTVSVIYDDEERETTAQMLEEQGFKTEQRGNNLIVYGWV